MDIEPPKSNEVKPPVQPPVPHQVVIGKTIYASPLQQPATNLRDQIKQNQPDDVIQGIFQSFLQSFCDEYEKLLENNRILLSKNTAKYLLTELGPKFHSFESNQYLNFDQSPNGKTDNPNPITPKVFLLHEIHQKFCSQPKDSPQTQALSNLLVDLRAIEPRIGFQFLIYLSSVIQKQQKQTLSDTWLNKQSPQLKKLKKGGSNRKEQQRDSLTSLIAAISRFDFPTPNSEVFVPYLSFLPTNPASFLEDAKVTPLFFSNHLLLLSYLPRFLPFHYFSCVWNQTQILIFGCFHNFVNLLLFLINQIL